MVLYEKEEGKQIQEIETQNINCSECYNNFK
jgi:hypothetical protein